MKTQRLTVAQATIKFLKNQFSKRDNIEYPFLLVALEYLVTEMLLVWVKP